MTITSYKQQFDEYSLRRLLRLIERSNQCTNNKTVQDIVGYSQQLFTCGGKRVRPYMADLAFRTAGGSAHGVITEVAFALELFHLFCLVHDDIIDESKVRHGISTAHIWHAKEKGIKVGGDQALLLGDLIFSWVNETYVQGILQLENPAIRSQAMECFQSMIEEVVLGQMLDVDATTKQVLSQEELDEKTRLKTSRYTFVGPLNIGFCLAGSFQKYHQFTEEFGTALGMAFQIQDDILDIMSTEELLQKSSLNDIINHQHTFFSHFMQHEASADFARQWNQLQYSSTLQATHIKDLAQQSGALAAGLKQVEQYIKNARSSLHQADLSSEVINEWNAIISMIENRRS